MENIIETRDLTKEYGDFTAVDHLDMVVKKGEFFGLLGPNGAGKTTTILMLLGLTEPTSGKISVLGLDPARQPLRVKTSVGYIPDQVGFYEELTCRENLNYIAKLNGLSYREADQRIKEAISRVGLDSVLNKRVSTLSHGMKQRLGVADVLIKKPRLIIMDEPTQGLDPEGAHEFLNMVLSFKEDDITVLLSSHLLHQVQAVCDRVGLFSSGKMVLEGSVAELAQQVLGGAYHIRVETDQIRPEITKALQSLPDAISVRPDGSRHYEIEAKQDLRTEAASTIINAGGKLFALDIETQSLDNIYTRYFEEVENVAAN